MRLCSSSWKGQVFVDCLGDLERGHQIQGEAGNNAERTKGDNGSGKDLRICSAREV